MQKKHFAYLGIFLLSLLFFNFISAQGIGYDNLHKAVRFLDLDFTGTNGFDDFLDDVGNASGNISIENVAFINESNVFSEDNIFNQKVYFGDSDAYLTYFMGNIITDANLASVGNFSSLGNYLCDSTTCYLISDLNNTGIGGGNPFDQSLNTTDDVSFNTLRIGATSSSSPFYVNKSASGSMMLLENTGYGYTSIQLKNLYGYVNFLSSTNDFVVQTGGVEKMRLKSTGNLGIGTTNPAHLLHVKDGNFELESIQPIMYFIENDTSSSWRLQVANGDFYWSEVTTEGSFVSHAMTIKDTTNYVGIGTTSPTHKLNVIGDINITGNYIVNGSTGYSGTCVNTTFVGGIATGCND